MTAPRLLNLRRHAAPTPESILVAAVAALPCPAFPRMPEKRAETAALRNRIAHHALRLRREMGLPLRAALVIARGDESRKTLFR